MLALYIKVKNYSAIPQVLKDFEVPNGRLVLQPGHQVDIPKGTWVRHAKKYQTWLKRVNILDILDEVEDEPQVEVVRRRRRTKLNTDTVVEIEVKPTTADKPKRRRKRKMTLKTKEEGE